MITVILINNVLNPFDNEVLKGNSVIEVLEEKFPQGFPLNWDILHGTWDNKCVVTPKTPEDIEKLNSLQGVFFVMQSPKAAVPAWVFYAIAIVAAVAAIVLMPKPALPSLDGSNLASPNNSLSNRVNSQRLGGRVPDIFGTVWSIPDLISPTYNFYNNHKQYECSHYAIGVGSYNVVGAYEDTTKVELIDGSNVEVYGVNTNYRSNPQIIFGAPIPQVESARSHWAIKKYTSINGQELYAPSETITLEDNSLFVSGDGTLTLTPSFQKEYNFTTICKVGDTLELDMTNVTSPSNQIDYTGYNFLYNLQDVTPAKEEGETSDKKQELLATVELANNSEQNYILSASQEFSAVGIDYEGREHDLGESYNKEIIFGMNNAFRQIKLTAKLLNLQQVKLEQGKVKTDYSANKNDGGQPPRVINYTLKGQYIIKEVTASSITLDTTPSQQNWNLLLATKETLLAPKTVINTSAEGIWLGWFYTDHGDHSHVILNFKAPNGIFADFGDNWKALPIRLQVESEVIDDKGDVVEGTLHTQQATIASRKWGTHYSNGIRISDIEVKKPAAVTITVNNPNFSRGMRMRVRVKRTTPLFKYKDGNVSQQVKWESMYGVIVFPSQYIPDGITIASSRSLATEGALSIKERRLKLQVTRLVKDWKNNNALKQSNRIDDILYHIVTTTGGYDSSYLNMEQITAEVNRNIEYFGTDLCAQFNGTFDDTKISIEEMIDTVAQAGFFRAYRMNGKIYLHFDAMGNNPVANFNSGNITPDSFELSESFGPRNDFDGVELTYINGATGLSETMKFPESSFKPQKLEIKGVTNKVQAYMHCRRTHWKNMYANVSCGFEAAEETMLVIPTNVVTVAEQYNTTSKQLIIDEIDGRIVYFNEAHGLTSKGTLFAQCNDGSVEKIVCSPVIGNPFAVQLQYEFKRILPQAFSIAATIVESNFEQNLYFICTEKTTGSNVYTNKIQCINYTDKYYQNDQDFKLGKITL
jgi:hypothetical protein|nr:MAG TPA: tail protein [Caudoviricetes sp.]